VKSSLWVALAVSLLTPIAASAQTGGAALDGAAAEQSSQGPMVVERVHNGFLGAPEFKFTEVDHRSSGLAGGYLGFVFDEHVFVGGAGYVLTTERRGRDMAYGGLLLQWLAGGNDTFGFGARTLLGGGTADSIGTIQVFDRGRPISEPFRARRNFLVAEPGVDARVRLADSVHLAVGVGYRFTGSEWGRRGSFDVPGGRLNGAVGSIALQIGGGS
jgi:hypothetical protein